MQQAALSRRERQVGVGVVLRFCCFGVCQRKSARSAGDLLFSLCKLLEYSCVDILPQITQITQTNTAELYYFAEYFVWIIGVIGDYLVIV